jgi:hypothetical protein
MTDTREALVLTMVWPNHMAPRIGDLYCHQGKEYRITGHLPDHRKEWFKRAITLILESIGDEARATPQP